MICLGSLKAIEQVEMANYWIAESTDEQGADKHKERLDLSSDSFTDVQAWYGLIWQNGEKKKYARNVLPFLMILQIVD